MVFMVVDGTGDVCEEGYGGGRRRDGAMNPRLGLEEPSVLFGPDTTLASLGSMTARVLALEICLGSLAVSYA